MAIHFHKFVKLPEAVNLPQYRLINYYFRPAFVPVYEKLFTYQKARGWRLEGDLEFRHAGPKDMNHDHDSQSEQPIWDIHPAAGLGSQPQLDWPSRVACDLQSSRVTKPSRLCPSAERAKL